jgi:hypothetical protein
MVKNSTNINKTKESLISDGQEFHQYLSTKQTITSHIKPLIIKMTMIYDVGNRAHALDTYKIMTGFNHLIVSKMYSMAKTNFSRNFLKNNFWVIIEFHIK